MLTVSLGVGWWMATLRINVQCSALLWMLDSLLRRLLHRSLGAAKGGLEP